MVSEIYFEEKVAIGHHVCLKVSILFPGALITSVGILHALDTHTLGECANNAINHAQ